MSDIPPDASSDTATEVFVAHRELLFSIVYNMLGTVTDTEDVLQETWLSWTARSADPGAERIGNPRGYLVRIAVNQALARQATIRRRRETYVGPWLPEPLVSAEDAADAAVPAESVSIALLVVLETLSPLERAVFVLHEVFGYGHSEIAGILERSPAAIRQLGHRAREHVHARRPRFQVEPEVRQRVTERFVAATVGGDLEALMALLAPDVTLWSDGGGKVPRANLHPVHGRDKVARLLIGVATRPPDGLRVGYRRANGDPSVLLLVGNTPFAVMVLDPAQHGEQVSVIYAVANPEKLSHLT